MLEGLWKETDDDPFKTVKPEYKEMLQQKQSQQRVPPKIIDVKELDKQAVRTKNII